MYDLIIIGGGPAGISASIYAARYKINFVLITETLGGWLNEIDKIENYPGFKSISGFELIEKYEEQLAYLEAPILRQNVIDIKRADKKKFIIKTNTNEEYKANTIIIASGSKKQLLNIPGEKELLGRGVSYCAICDAMFFKEKTVAVAGGANSAVSAALHLSKIAKKVYLIYRKETLRADKALIDNLKNTPNIEIIYNTNILKINGVEKVESVALDNPYYHAKTTSRDIAPKNKNNEMQATARAVASDNKNILKLDGVFIEIGLIPITELVGDIGVELDNKNQIKVNDKCYTNVEGVFAAGDATNGQGELKQFVTALASGAIAVTSANKYLKTV